MQDNHIKPKTLHALLELRAPLEALSVAAAMPILKKAPQGDGQPVIVLPGFMTGDNATYILRRYLENQGFTPLAWEQGTNPGLRHDIYLSLEQYIEEVYNKYGQKISLVGWSLGGLYARTLGHRIPSKIRQVITLGSPFAIDSSFSDDEVGVSGPVMKLYERLNPDVGEDELATGEAIWESPPPVPSSAIYSANDGVASWRYCIDNVCERTENIKIFGSHMGLTHNPLVFFALADRLAQPLGSWKHFESTGLRKLFFGEPRLKRQ